MNEGLLQQGQPLSALGLPDYLAEGVSPFRVGSMCCTGIVVSQLRGPMGWYDVAVVTFSDQSPAQIHPLHLCDFIAT